ncbi:MAG: portal protein [Sphaerochaeta sp.]|jgi:hypothetical protein|nr:portal protein [Sphaerochaeta sp.]
MKNDVLVTNLLNRQLRLEQVRAGFEDEMDLAFRYVNPRRYRTGGVQGAQRKTKMYDGVAQDAFFDWVAGMEGWGVSENLDWHRAAISTPKLRDSDSVQRWLDEYTEQMAWEFQTGNLYECMPEYYQDAGSGGTAVTLTEESHDLSRCVHRVPHPGTYWIAENDEHEIDIYHELTTMTCRQAVEKFGGADDTLPKLIRDWSVDPQGSLWECDFLTCICPADDKAIFERNVTVGRKPYAAVTVLYRVSAGSGVPSDGVLTDIAAGDRLVRVQGYDYFPATVWRFRRNSDEIYGFSPAMDVMSVIEAAQQHAYNLMNMGNFAARPMMAVPDDKRSSFRYLPGERFKYADEKRIPMPIPMGGEYPIAVDRENKIHDLIRKRYGYHVWNMLPLLQQKKERVQATEVLEGRADQARLLVGQFNNFWRGGMRPTYNNVAQIAARAGRLPAAPNVLQEYRGRDIVIPMFVGPLSVLQLQTASLGRLRGGLSLLGDVAEILGRHVGAEEAAKIYARVRLPDLAEYICDHSFFPQQLMNDDETTAAIIAAREQRAAALQEAMAAQKLAAAAGQMGKPVDESSLLARVG